ncbi:tetratricopeptide repeat protein [Halarcobacter anaerophilus]|nr:tetratricopeptide repeat protein [Halarcobacter anaerophilus]
MPGYSRIVILIIFSFFISGCSFLNEPQKSNLINPDFKYKTFAQEDRYVMYALEYLREGNKEEAADLFEKLYENTFNNEYLLEYSRLSFALKRYDDLIEIIEKNREKITNSEDNILKIYILALVQKSEFEKAEKEIKNLLKIEENDSIYELLGSVYIRKGEYNKAKELFGKIYERTSSISSLLSLTDIMYRYTNQRAEAINLLESYITIRGCDNIICSRLLELYQNENNIDGVISILKRTYITFKDKGNAQALEKIYKLLMFYLEKKDVKEAISFLEESGANDEKLLSLYKATQEYKKAYTLANKLYEKSSNIDYLAQIAIIEFEMAKDKRKVLKGVIKKFEYVLTVLDSHVYQNYLGYLLIDYDIDVKKGLYFVKKALEKAPNNLAYIDSLAWGQYKLKDCENAYINMKKVIDATGLNDDEIRLHWEKIKECNK